MLQSIDVCQFTEPQQQPWVVGRCSLSCFTDEQTEAQKG